MTKKIETIVVCYTQATFDELARPNDDDYDEPNQEVQQARYLATLALALKKALDTTNLTSEIVRLPQRSYAPRDILKATFAWRILDLKEANNRPIDLALCLDFPASALQHPHKTIWLTNLPNFLTRRTQTPITKPSFDPKDKKTENAQAIASLLQAEGRAVREAHRLLAATRPIAEELARNGLQAEFNPLPTDLDNPLEWQAPLQRLLRNTP